MQITNEAADIINHYLDDVFENIQLIESAIQLNKEFNNQFDIDAYLHPYRKYKGDDTLDNGQVYCIGETLYESILLWGFNYFKEQLGGFNRYLTYSFDDYYHGYDDGELQEVFNMLSEEEQLKLYDDPVCKYYILYKFSLDIKI